MSVRMSSASWGKEGTWSCTFIVMHDLQNLASVGSFFEFPPYFLDGALGRDRSTTFLLSMQRLNGECLLQSGRMALHCASCIGM